MENFDDPYDQQELTGLIYFQNQAIWCGVLKHLLLFDAVSFAAKGARDFESLAREATAKGDGRLALDMTMAAEQLGYFADTSEGVSSLLAYFGIRQLLNRSIVTRDSLIPYVQKILVLARIPGLPNAPDFVLLAGDQKALYVTEENDVLAECAGEIESQVLNQASLNHIAGELMR